MKKLILLLLVAFVHTASLAQEDLLSLVEDETEVKKEFVKYAFKSPRVINGHSMEFLSPGTMDFRILHRFGNVNSIKDLFGLDQASMRMGFDFGIKKNLMAGIGRSTFKKELDGFLKFAPIMQSTGPHSSPVTIALVSGITLQTLPWADPTVKNYFTSRLAYYHQVIIGRKWSEALSFQLSPTLVHHNIVPFSYQPNDIYSIGFGGRLKLSSRIAFTWDYFHVLNGIQENSNTHPLSLGFDIETGGHVFQLHFSNAAGMNERAFIAETTGRWDKAEVRFGFNLSRVFQLKKKKEK
jgi:hypothetical protein